ncbi:MAG: proton-conducting transporter membrane subunit [Pseudomonadota bacterium]
MTGHTGFILSFVAFAAVLLGAPLLATNTRERSAWISAVCVLGILTFALITSSGVFAYLALALVTAMHAASAWHRAPTGALYLVAASVTLIAAAAAIAFDSDNLAFGLSCVALALRAGLAPFHAGVAEMCMKQRELQLQQSSSLLILVLAHLYYIDHLPIAYEMAPFLVIWGAVLTLLYALTALAQRELGGLLRSSTLMHAGMLYAAVGAGARGHYGAALLVTVTLVFALGGLSLTISALEARLGKISLLGPAVGRARAFPRLAAAFAFFGAAGVGMPGTAGFIADDVLLHALWEESPAGAVIIIFGSAILAVATLSVLAKTFFGPALRVHTPDLLMQERSVVVALVLLLLGLGLVPQLLVGVAELVLGNTI